MEFFPNETDSTDLHALPWSEPQLILSVVILSLTFLLGLPGNGLVLWVAGLKMKWTVSTVWFLHLTLADFLCCLSLPFSLAHLALQGHWPYGRPLCKLIPSIIILNMFASVFLLTTISLDRCLLVLKPIWCQNHRNVRAAFIICVCIWAVALIMCVPVFIYRETFTIDDHNICSYYFGGDSSYDYDGPENGSFDDSIIQLSGEMNHSSDAFPLQTNDHPWTTTSLLPSQTFQRLPGDSPPLDSARLSNQHPHYKLIKPDDEVLPTTPIGLPTDDHRTDPMSNLNTFLSTSLELFSTASSNAFYRAELSQDFLDDGEDFFAYDNQVPTPLVVMAITRLVMGFLLPLIAMLTCYGLIIFRMRRGRFAKSRSKTLRVSMVVVVVFLVCWAPYHIVGVLSLFIDPDTPFGEALRFLDHMSIALASANSCLNPFLYAFMGKDFRKTAKQSMQGILEAAFSEDQTHSTNCTQNNTFSERNSSRAV